MPKIDLIDISPIGSYTPDGVYKIDRSCNGCTSCCDGTLSATILGYDMFQGVPCRYMKEGKGCSIYAMRPQDPCRTFKCAWKIDKRIPEKFKPTLSDVVMIHKRDVDNRFTWLTVLPKQNKEISVDLLAWLVYSFMTGQNPNIMYYHKGKWHFLSNNKEWLKYKATTEYTQNS